MRSRGSIKNVNGELQTQSMYFNWVAAAIVWNDNTRRTIPGFLWGSAPTENMYGHTIFHRSRLDGVINKIMVSKFEGTAGVTSEPLTVEIHTIAPWMLLRAGTTSMSGKITKVGEFTMTNDNTRQDGGMFDCHIPVKRGTVVLAIVYIPTMATNPVNNHLSIIAFVEGINPETDRSRSPRNTFGLKNADFVFTGNANSSYQPAGIYYHPGASQFTAWGTSIGTMQVSPYDGFVEEMVFHTGLFGVAPSKETVEFGLAMRNTINGQIVYCPAGNIVWTNYSSQSVKASICNIRIQRGQQFIPYIKTPTFGTPGTNIRVFCTVHIRGN